MYTAEEGKLKAILPYALPREIKIRTSGLLGKFKK
jgi:hypothetical protein